MRTIKFRAWDKVYKTTGQVNEISFDLNRLLLSEPNQAWGRNLQEVELMQFTGLLDKNGKEIYEGDIVEFNVNRVVEYQDGVYIIKSFDGHQMLLHGLNHDLEVLGNIYENPELIN